jgi:hypothetical protein
MELDVYGMSGDVAEGVTLDVGVLYYATIPSECSFGPAEYYGAPSMPNRHHARTGIATRLALPTRPIKNRLR